MCAQCFDTSIVPSPCPAIAAFLSILANAHAANPIHVRAHLTELGYSGISAFIGREKSIFDLITYEFFNLPIHRHRAETLSMALWLRSVVHFSDSWISRASCSSNLETIIEHIGPQLSDALSMGTISRPVASGRLYLCGIPELVLTPQELDSAIDIEDAALCRLYSMLRPLYNQTKPSWKDFTTRVKLVKSGFRPSIADLTEGRT